MVSQLVDGLTLFDTQWLELLLTTNDDSYDYDGDYDYSYDDFDGDYDSYDGDYDSRQWWW